jgi:hypothetical protein
MKNPWQRLVMQPNIEFVGYDFESNLIQNDAIEHGVAGTLVSRHRFIQAFQQAIKEPRLFLSDAWISSTHTVPYAITLLYTSAELQGDGWPRCRCPVSFT